MPNKEQPSLPSIDTLWNFGDPAATRQTFKDLLPQALAEAVATKSYYLQLLTQIARTHSLQAQFSEAHVLLDDVENQLGDGLELARVRYLLERGRCYNSTAQAERALPLFLEAAELAQSINAMRLAIDAVHMVAIASADRSDKIAWNLKGIALVEQHPEQHGWYWALYNNLGEEYLLSQEYEKAHETFQKLIHYQIERTGSPDMYTRKDDARALRFMGRADEALDAMQGVLNELQQKESDDGWIREEIGESLLVLQRNEEAKEHFAVAYTLLSADSYCQEHEIEKLSRLKELAGK